MTPRSRTAVAGWNPSAASTPLASWYTESLRDAIGDRLFMFDNSGTPSLELLRFRQEFGGASGFEDALRERVDAFHAFDHPSFSQVRAVERLDSGDLVLVSTFTTGKRVSEIFRSGHVRPGVHPAFAAWFIRESVSAIAALQRHVDDVAHAALTPDRVILAPNGRLVIVEHVLGAALDQLRLTVRGLQDLGLAAAGEGSSRAQLDQQADILQLAWIALSLLLGRRITPVEYPRRVDTLLDDFADASQGCSPVLIAAMRRWLERALFAGAGGFSSAIEAQAGLGDLRSHGGRHAIAFAASTTAVEELAFDCPQQLPPMDPLRSDSESPEVSLFTPEAVPETVSETLTMPRPLELVTERVKADVPGAKPAVAVTQPQVRRWNTGWVVAGVLALIAAGEAILLARSEFTRPAAALAPAPLVPVVIDSQQPGDQIIVDGRDVGVTPMTLALRSDMRSIRVRTRPSLDVFVPPAPIVDKPADTTSAAALNQAAARERRGGLRVSSPIELQVLEGDRVLGTSTDGPVVATAGKHELDFVNTEFGYQSHQVVDIKAGQIVPMKVSPPDGRVSINAVPWASVSIDGNSLGETPLGNVALPVGEHQITFRHPQFGERTQKVIVKANASTRVSVVLTR
ncbi:MAG TPA: PEGA domain-containing protein [Vicinamibacterales bacterium]|nr:PEGA domain-containing protein [Vicinamibacterales bacterium]